ncbi:MAG: polyprenyl synthetase family protein [Sedimentisphaerales bacterium]|nr:polyprenyl synthetase family protein [Sedimentisphaerales bacterium]
MKLLRLYDILAQELENVREVFAAELLDDDAVMADLVEHLGKFRGKMLRPMLVLLTGKAGGRILRDHYILAAVAEMVHMASLVHDDVLDEAEIRRRGSTINVLHGNEAAVMLGDWLISRAFHLCASLESQTATRLMAATAATVCRGELLQLYYRGFFELSEETYFKIIDRKTAAMIASCCYLGAWAAGAEDTTCRALEAYGRQTGMAFQIMDDLLDLTGQIHTAGKSLRRDLAQGKTTLPLIHYFRQATHQQIQAIKVALPSADDGIFDDIVEQLRSAGSLDYARRRAEMFIQTAHEYLDVPMEEDIRLLLIDLADAIVSE